MFSSCLNLEAYRFAIVQILRGKHNNSRGRSDSLLEGRLQFGARRIERIPRWDTSIDERQSLPLEHLEQADVLGHSDK
jgi:hypothetical protein